MWIFQTLNFQTYLDLQGLIMYLQTVDQMFMYFSEKHKMVCVGRNLEDHLVPPPLP